MNLRPLFATLLLATITASVLVAAPASAGPTSDCREARAFLRSDGALHACRASHLAARSLSCSSDRGERLLRRMAATCKARRSSPAPRSSNAPDAPEPKDAGAPKTGGKATITAFAMDGTTVLEVVACSVDPVSGPRFPECLKATKAKLGAAPRGVCAGKSGPVKFKYRMGDIAVLLTDKVDC